MVGGQDEHTGCISCCPETNEGKWIGSIQLGRVCTGGIVNILRSCIYFRSSLSLAGCRRFRSVC